MSIEKAVSNASPFILLSKCGLIDILPGIFAEIWMPESVSAEIIRGGDVASEQLYQCETTWLNRCLVPETKDVLAWNLGDGETQVLSHAFANKNTFVALVDDRAARRCAETLGIRTLGTGGILILAKRAGLIQSVQQALENLESEGLYLSDDVRAAILKGSNE